MPAPIQVTAEQLLREAKETEMELVPPVSTYSCFFCYITVFEFVFCKDITTVYKICKIIMKKL